MVRVMVLLLMMIPMMPGAMTVTVVMISPTRREFPLRNLPAGKVFLLSIVFIVKRWQKNSTKWLSDKIRSWGVSTLKGCRRSGLGLLGAH